MTEEPTSNQANIQASIQVTMGNCINALSKMTSNCLWTTMQCLMHAVSCSQRTRCFAQMVLRQDFQVLDNSSFDLGDALNLGCP